MFVVRLWGEMMKDTDASEETQVKYELHVSVEEINSLWRHDQYCCLQKSISSPSASVWMKPKELRQRAAELVLWFRLSHLVIVLNCSQDRVSTTQDNNKKKPYFRLNPTTTGHQGSTEFPPVTWKKFKWTSHLIEWGWSRVGGGEPTSITAFPLKENSSPPMP